MRQLVVSVEPDSKGLIEISGKDFRYMRQVLRIKPGDMVTVRSPSGRIGMTVCTIDDRTKKLVLQKCASPADSIEDQTAKNIPASCERPEIYLFQFVPKPQKMELIVRQAVECGVSCIVPVLGKYTQAGSEKSLASSGNKEGSRRDRYSRIIREAMQQSGAINETRLTEPMTLEAALEFWKSETAGIADDADKDKAGIKQSAAVVLYERTDGAGGLKEALCGKAGDACKSGNADDLCDLKKIAVAVGCEGGISPEEYALLVQNGFGAVHFNVNILRCETAALYGIAAVQSAIDNFLQ